MNMVIISSAIHTSVAPLSYTPVRSVFSHQQRFEQSIKTVESIRQHVPNAYIVFAEGTKLIDEYKNKLRGIVDYLHEAGNIAEVYTHVMGPYKGLGETISILTYFQSAEYIALRASVNIATVSKISGRYYMTNEFNFETPQNNSILAKYDFNNNDHPLRKWMSTVFFTVSQDAIDRFIIALENTFNSHEIRAGIAFEHIICASLLATGIVFQQKDPFHVGGEYGPWGGYVEH